MSGAELMFGENVMIHKLPSFLTLTVLACSIAGLFHSCSSERPPELTKDSTGPQLVDLPPGIFDQFEEPALTTNLALQKASQSVVRIELPAGKQGTGFFLGDENLLITNAHVIGPEQCFRSGCFVRIHSNQHRVAEGQAATNWRILVPVAFSEKLDVAAFEVYENIERSLRYRHPFQISWDPRNLPPATQAVDRTAYLLGHPLGYLLKITRGPVVSLGGSFLTSELLSLPGTSGGPLLDESGNLLGVHHRGTQDLQYLRNASYFGVSLSTTAEELASVLDSTKRESSLWLFKNFSDFGDDLFEKQKYWEALGAAWLDQESSMDAEAIAESLWNLCTEPFNGKVNAACDLAVLRLSCAHEHEPLIAPQSSCPSSDNQSKWIERFNNRAKLYPHSSSQNFLWQVLAPNRLSAQSDLDGKAAQWTEKMLGERANAGLNLEVVLVSLDTTHSKGITDPTILTWFSNPQSVQNYHFLYNSLLKGTYLLMRDGLLKKETGQETLLKVKNDPLATLSDLFLADWLLWQSEQLTESKQQSSLHFSLYEKSHLRPSQLAAQNQIPE